MSLAKAKTPWDDCVQLPIVRPESSFHRPRVKDCPAYCRLEPGVIYFSLMIEQLGGRTVFSCEGHPHAFYIACFLPYEMAYRIKACSSVFDVEVLNNRNLFKLSMRSQECNRGLVDHVTSDGRFTEVHCHPEGFHHGQRVELLRQASLDWQKDLGKLRMSKVRFKLEQYSVFEEEDIERRRWVDAYQRRMARKDKDKDRVRHVAN